MKIKKYRYESSTVEAARFAGCETSIEDAKTLCGDRFSYRSGKGYFLATPKGDIPVSYDDYIIREENGKVYPCKPDIFVKNYEEV